MTFTANRLKSRYGGADFLDNVIPKSADSMAPDTSVQATELRFMVAGGVSDSVPFKEASGPASQASLDVMMFRLLDRLRDFSGELPQFGRVRGVWTFSFSLPGNGETVDLRFERVSNSHYPLTITRHGQTVPYRFRNERDLARIIPTPLSESQNRWHDDEATFAKTLPRLLAPNHGRSEGPSR